MSMLTRVAKGIHASLCGAPSIDADTQWHTMPETQKSPYIAAALRMLTIIRTPTEQMVIEGNQRGLGGGAADVWERMAYRALHED